MSKEERMNVIVELLKQFNKLHNGIGSDPMFTWEIEASSVYVYSLTDNLLALHLVCHHSLRDVCCYQQSRNNQNCLEFLVTK